MRRAGNTIPLVAATGWLFLLGLLGHGAALAQPSSVLTPTEVVRAQLDGLQAPDDPEPDAGIAEVYAFASPGNRSQTGPFPRFARMVKLGYPEMLGHRTARVEDVAAADGEALVAVRLVSDSGTVHRYVFLLRQYTTEGCVDCWLTDGVVERETDEPPEIAT